MPNWVVETSCQLSYMDMAKSRYVVGWVIVLVCWAYELLPDRARHWSNYNRNPTIYSWNILVWTPPIEILSFRSAGGLSQFFLTLARTQSPAVISLGCSPSVKNPSRRSNGLSTVRRSKWSPGRTKYITPNRSICAWSAGGATTRCTLLFKNPLVQNCSASAMFTVMLPG